MTEKSTHPESAANILIVDDTPANLQILTAMLKKRGYEPRPVPNGKLALQAIKVERPDLVLLDINMPGMDGYAVCAEMKKNPDFAEIPVIFISAYCETGAKLRAFAAGGVDYVTKPFQVEEVEARVKMHLALRRQQMELERSYRRLRELEALRDNLVHMVIHDVRTPMTVIRAYLELLESEPLPEDSGSMVKEAAITTNSVIEMISSVLDVSKMEWGRLKLCLAECDLVTIARQIMDEVAVLTKRRKVTLLAKESSAPLRGDPTLLARVIQNLVGNAIQQTSIDGTIDIEISVEGDLVRLAVKDDGPGIAAEHHTRIFEKYGQVDSEQRKWKYSTGLGLTFCKLAVEAHGGRIGVESTLGCGSTFWCVLPKDGPTDSASPAKRDASDSQDVTSRPPG